MSFLPFWVSFRMEETPSLLIRLQAMVTLSSLTSLRWSLKKDNIFLSLCGHTTFKFYSHNKLRIWRKQTKIGINILYCLKLLLYCTVCWNYNTYTTCMSWQCCTEGVVGLSCISSTGTELRWLLKVSGVTASWASTRHNTETSLYINIEASLSSNCQIQSNLPSHCSEEAKFSVHLMLQSSSQNKWYQPLTGQQHQSAL